MRNQLSMIQTINNYPKKTINFRQNARTNFTHSLQVSAWQTIQWMRDPQPIERAESFPPFQCDYKVQNWDYKVQNCNYKVQNCDHKVHNCDYTVQNCDFKVQNCDHMVHNCDYKVHSCDYEVQNCNYKVQNYDHKVHSCDFKIHNFDYKVQTCDYKVPTKLCFQVTTRRYQLLQILFTRYIRTMFKQTVFTEKRPDQDPCFFFKIFEFDNVIRKKKTACELCQLLGKHLILTRVEKEEETSPELCQLCGSAYSPVTAPCWQGGPHSP